MQQAQKFTDLPKPPVTLALMEMLSRQNQFWFAFFLLLLLAAATEVALAACSLPSVLTQLLLLSAQPGSKPRQLS